MSIKRQATTELNHDNWDREEEAEERGTFRTANEDELKTRVIKKAKRKIAPGAAIDAADGSSDTKSVFSSFSGFGKPSVSTAVSSSPFSFLSKIPAVAAGASVTSAGVSSSTTLTGATPTFSFGSGLTVTTGASKATESSKPASTSIFSFGNTSSSTTVLNATATATSNQSSSVSFGHSEYYRKLSSLNQAVSEWIKTHVDKNPVCILSPIFKDYEKYLKEIEDEKKLEDSKGSTAVTTVGMSENPPQSSGLASFKFSNNNNSLTSDGIESNEAAATSTTTETVAKTNGFSFGLKKPEDKPQEYKPAAASTFSFSLKPSVAESSTSTTASTTAPTTSFSFGNVSNSNTTVGTSAKSFSFTPGATPFSFGNIKPPAANADATTSGIDDNEDKDEEPPKNEFTQVVEKDAVYSKKCKVFVKKDGNFVDKGVGTLYLKPIESTGKTQLLVRADTNLGNILVNLILNSAIPAQRMGKNNVMMVCLPTPDVEKPTSMLLRVKTGEEADELLENIDRYKK